ncbi:MAG TPA: hypothetical protein VL359_20675, partial [bacterium]|nr:hypothetical protein [bacterium]
QQPFVESFPASPAARALLRLAALLEHPPVTSAPVAAPGAWSTAPAGSSFWDRLLHWKKAK